VGGEGGTTAVNTSSEVQGWVKGLAMIGLFAFALSDSRSNVVHAQTVVARPLSEILVSGPEFTDLRPDSVTVMIETRIPVVCAAVYGVTAAYGQLATDTNMAAGGHQSHHPVLTGLKPDTLYQMRMQGVGPDGTLYVSDNYTFHTGAAVAGGQPPNKPLGRNVALISAGASIVAVSSNYGGGALNSPFGANNAIDGDAATQWSSNGDGDKAWIEIDLGKEYAVSGVGFLTRTMGSSAQIESFQVVTGKGEKFGPFSLPDARSMYYFPLTTTARKLRFETLKSTGGNTGASEIEVYAQ
jgi:hypothetical protein